MCGRYTLTSAPETIAEAFHLDRPPEHVPRYNIAPSQPIITIVTDPETRHRESRFMIWGLIPAWSKDPSKGLINARAETVHEKPSFRSALKRRRCLIPADGFYEWQKLERSKQPFYFHLRDRPVFAFAGLWESYQDIETCTIITTTANSLLEPIHDRMPVILEPDQYDLWLDPAMDRVEALWPLLNPFADDLMDAFPVSRRVNSAHQDDPSCIHPLEDNQD